MDRYVRMAKLKKLSGGSVGEELSGVGRRLELSYLAGGAVNNKWA